MSFGTEFNSPEFNQAEFNQVDQTDLYILSVLIGMVYQPIYVGYSNVLPANKLFLNTQYELRREGPSGLAVFYFITPPATAYDGLGG